MTEVWVTVAAVGLFTIAFKALGPVALGGRTLPPRLLSIVELLAPASSSCSLPRSLPRSSSRRFSRASATSSSTRARSGSSPP